MQPDPDRDHEIKQALALVAQDTRDGFAELEALLAVPTPLPRRLTDYLAFHHASEAPPKGEC
ncbi:hypothetical protein EAT51_12040 [Pseudoxanthomonas winnipegensis]|uniref:hypothetical protein n=1 Tax=Pseudoxanthomonas winnipegensis TaxID=2480810 RepID=UPI00102DCD30|nr:hypothetical protein [Pseudoxanthomonas winnipegensis]TAA40702.1 hypothetical protein EAT51_12040 [Pseudoxanthomonas winnipegensis]